MTSELNTIKSELDMDIFHVIMIHYKEPSKQLYQTVEDLKTVSGLKVEFFHVDFLQFNPTKHELVPIHELAPEEEQKDLRKGELPMLLSHDPMVRFYGYEKGDIVKITRKSGIICYRVVR